MPTIERITIAGVGLIGTSLALALKHAGFCGQIVGVDEARALREAARMGALDATSEELSSAVSESEVIVLAAPVRANLALLQEASRCVSPGTLITDVGSTKQEIADLSQKLFGPDALRRFLPGHPIAGKELSGARNAAPALFHGAPWVVTPPGGRHALIAPEFSRGIHREFMSLIESIGARLVVTTPEKHDRVLAFTSHLPQLVSTALANVVEHELGGKPELRDLSGRALREMVRLAKSDPRVWAEITSANRSNIESALQAMEQALYALRSSIGTPEFERLFAQGGELDPDAEPKSADDFEPPRFG